MMMHFTIWDILSLLAYRALIWAGPVLLFVAVLLLAIPACRRGAWVRRTAYGAMALDLGLASVAAPVLAYDVNDWLRVREYASRTHHLDAPQAYGGVAFPAGSTVHVGQEGRAEFGTLPVPTPILGLVLVGKFRLGAEYGTGPVGVMDGTLAAAADVHGIPCGPGAIKAQEETTRCVLARDYAFTGHLLAAGTSLEVYRSPLHQPPKLTFGTLARPELLYDVLWPAGTVMGGVSQSPARMAHGPEPESQPVELCLPPGLTATIPGATLHGFLGYSTDEDGRRLISPVCSVLPDNQVGSGGYAQVGADRYDEAERPDAHSAWRWQTRFKQGAP